MNTYLPLSRVDPTNVRTRILRNPRMYNGIDTIMFFDPTETGQDQEENKDVSLEELRNIANATKRLPLP